MPQTIHLNDARESGHISNSPKKYFWWHKIIARYKARIRSKKIINSLREVEEIQKGKKKGQTLDSFLNDL